MSSSSKAQSVHKSMGPPAVGLGSVKFQEKSGSLSPSNSLNENPALQIDGQKGRALSCSECKRRKIKCDRGFPCGPCVLRNDQSRCKPVIRWEGGCSQSDFKLLQSRVLELEERVNDMQEVLGGSSTALGSQKVIPPSNQTTPSKPEAVNNQIAGPTSGNGSSIQRGGGGEDDAVMMLEDFAMGNRAHARRVAQKLNNDPRAGDSPDSAYLETGANQRSPDAAIDVAYRFLRLAPSFEVTRTIVDYYFDRLEWQTRCLHRPSYMQDLQLLLSLDYETAARTVRPTFLCVHFMVLCLAIHLASGEEVLRWGMDTSAAMSLCDILFAGSQQLLWSSDFIGTHQLEHLQAVVLISVYAYNVDEQADAAFALVGAAIKIAQNLSLNRLDDRRFMEKELAKNRLASGGRETGEQSHLQTELSKRVWWYLIWLDWSHALSHGGSYTINPAHNSTNLPSNVNDEDLGTSDKMLVAKPMDEYTTMSFSIWRIRFLQVYRETIDMINQPGGMTHTQIVDIDKKLLNLLHGLPSYFQLKTEDSKSWTFGDSCHDMELLSIQITGHNRILRLHRPYLAKGLQDRNNISRKRCVEAAFSILALFRHARKHAPILLRVWINIYYVFSGALVLFLDLCYDNDAGARAVEEKRLALKEMLEICSQARHLSAAAKNTHNLLQGLLEAENELRGRREGDASQLITASGAKRKRSGTVGESTRSPTTPFVSLVERVLIDASTKHSSGDSTTSSSIGKSPGEPSGRTTSYIRDRTSSLDSRHARDSPMSSGIGGFIHDPSSSASSHFSRANPGYPLSSIKSGISSQPTSPWGSSSAIRSTAWNQGGNNNNNNNSGFASPTTSASGYNLLSPGINYQGGDVQTAAASTAKGGNNFTFNINPRSAETTNGLSSLLDEDIFSGVLMGQPMQNNSDWASAFNFVAPLSVPPQHQHQHAHPQPQNHHHHPMHTSTSQQHYQEG